MKINQLNPEYAAKLPRLIELYIAVLKNTKALKDFDENTNRQFFILKDLTPTIKDELEEQFESIAENVIDYHKELRPILSELSTNYSSVFYSARNKQGDNDTVDSLMSSKNIKYILTDALWVEDTTLSNQPMVKPYNRLFNVSINKLIDIGNSLVNSIREELSLEYNGNCTNDYDSHLMSIQKAADNYDLRDLVKKHKTENVIQILSESMSFNINSVHRANILNFISNLIGSPAAYNQLDNTVPVNSKDIAIDIFRRMSHMLLAIRHYSASRLRIANLDNKRAHECLLNIQKEIAGIRFNKAEAVCAADIDDETITDGVMLKNNNSFISVKVIKTVNNEVESRLNYYSTIYLTTDQNVNYNFNTDMDKINDILDEEDILEYLGKLAIEFYIELYRMDSDYLDMYYNKAKEAISDTVSKFITANDLLLSNSIDSNITNEILLDNKKLDVTIGEIYSNENLMGSTSDEDQKKELVKIATMLAVYIGDLRYGDTK